MIHIQVNPAKVVKVLFVADSALEEDLDFAAWQTIRPLVNEINQRLNGIAREIVGGHATADRAAP